MFGTPNQYIVYTGAIYSKVNLLFPFILQPREWVNSELFGRKQSLKGIKNDVLNTTCSYGPLILITVNEGINFKKFTQIQMHF